MQGITVTILRFPQKDSPAIHPPTFSLNVLTSYRKALPAWMDADEDEVPEVGGQRTGPRERRTEDGGQCSAGIHPCSSENIYVGSRK